MPILKVSPDVLEVLQEMNWQEGGRIGVIEHDLEPDLHYRVSRTLIVLGGKWSTQGYFFPVDPRPMVAGL